MKLTTTLASVLAATTAIGGVAFAESSTDAPSARDQVERADDARMLPVDRVEFAFDSSRVGAVDRLQLDAVAAWLVDHPGYYLVVEGHTDTIGTDVYNLGLASDRAQTVRREILDAADGEIPARRIVAAVYGERAPIPGDAAGSRRAVMYVTHTRPVTLVDDLMPGAFAVLWPRPDTGTIASR